MKHADEERSLHRRAWEAIPWLVNGRIDEAEHTLLEEHLRACADCRDELALQRRLRDGVLRQAGPAADADAALGRLWQRIDAEGAMTRLPGAGRQGAWQRWLVAAAVVQAVALAALVGANFGSGTPQYRTFSAATPAAAPHAIRAVFASDLPLVDLQRILEGADLRIVDGPNEGGVYTLVPRGLAPPATAPHDAALARLRADARVRFAEPVADAPAR